LAQPDKKKYIPDLLPTGTIVDVVKTDKDGEFSGLKSMLYGEWKKLVKQPGFVYRAYQKGFSQFNKK